MESQAEGRRIARSTAIFSLATGVSRIFGVVREAVAANYFGANGKINAFTIAFAVPNLVRALVADAALSSAFVPVFSDLLEKGDRKRAWRVASTVFWLSLLALSAISALFILIAPLLFRPFGNPGHDVDLTIGLSRVLFPIVALLGVSGVIVGILNSYEHFSVPALSPVLWNVAIIVGLVIGVPQAHGDDARLYVYAGAILVGTIVQVLLPVPWLRGRDDRLRMVIDWRDPAVARVFRLMIPVTVGLGLINFNAVVDAGFASRFYPDIGPTAIEKAFRLYMLPQGLFSVAVATVLFPSLARLASRGDLDGFRETVALGLRQIAFMLVPASVVTIVLAEPITRLVYERGKWGPHETAVTAAAIAAFSGGLAFNGAMLMLNRAFFSLQSSWLPTIVSLSNLALNAALDVVLYRVGVWGIPLATTIVNFVGMLFLLFLLRRRIGRLELRGTLSALARIVPAAALAAAAFFVWLPLDRALGRSFPGQLASLLPALAAAAGLYLGACRVLGVRELDTLMSLRSRFRRSDIN